MIDKFKEAAIHELNLAFPFSHEEDLLRIASIMWDLIPKIYTGNEDEQKYVK